MFELRLYWGFDNKHKLTNVRKCLQMLTDDTKCQQIIIINVKKSSVNECDQILTNNILTFQNQS